MWCGYHDSMRTNNQGLFNIPFMNLHWDQFGLHSFSFLFISFPTVALFAIHVPVSTKAEGDTERNIWECERLSISVQCQEKASRLFTFIGTLKRTEGMNENYAPKCVWEMSDLLGSCFNVCTAEFISFYGGKTSFRLEGELIRGQYLLIVWELKKKKDWGP